MKEKIDEAVALLKGEGFLVAGNGIATGINFLGEGQAKKESIFKDLASLIQRDIPLVLMQATEDITDLDSTKAVVLMYTVVFEKDDDKYSLKK